MGVPLTDTPDERALRQRLLAETRADLLKRQLSNSENYDKAILSLSTVFLGLSLTFLKNFVPHPLACTVWLLYCSWGALATAVVATVLSFLVSQRAIDVQLKKAEAYYLNADETALRKSVIARVTDWINLGSGIAFVSGVLLTTAFVIMNFNGGK